MIGVERQVSCILSVSNRKCTLKAAVNCFSQWERSTVKPECCLVVQTVERQAVNQPDVGYKHREFGCDTGLCNW